MEVKQTDGRQLAGTGLHMFHLRSTSAKHHKASGSRNQPSPRWTGCRRLRRRSLGDGRRPVHIHRLTERERGHRTQGASAQHVSPLRPQAPSRPHLHVQLQDVRVRLQQLTHVGFGASKVSVDKLLDVAVGRREGKAHRRRSRWTSEAGSFRIPPGLSV